MFDQELLERAAFARREAGRQRADRPSQRRYAENATQACRGRIISPAQISVRAAGGDASRRDFEGHASVYERAYDMYDWYGPYMEVVSAGAGSASLSRSDLDVPLVLGHDSMRRLARTTTGTLQLSEDDSGLLVQAPGLDMADADVAYIMPKLDAGLLDEMSFMFWIKRGTWSPDYSEYRIDEYDIHRGDVSIVGYGANPYTDTGARSAQGSSRARALLELAIAR